MTLLRSAILATAVLFPITGFAQQIVATDASTVANFFTEEGADPLVETDNVGDPKVSVEYYGVDFQVFYYGCEDGANCDSIQFFSGYQTEGGVRISKMNEWNAEKRYAHAYISDGGSARIEQDVYLGKDGISTDDFAKLVGIWVRLMKEFEEHIDW